MKKNMKTWVQVIGGAILIVLVLNFVITPMHVDGRSMNPILKDNQYIVVNQLAYKNAEAEYGEIVVANNPSEETSKKMVKMVVGKPGDRIEYRNNVLFRNGKAVPEFVLSEDYLKPESVKEITILEDDQYYLLGKNLPESADSRDMGAISQADLIGKVIFK